MTPISIPVNWKNPMNINRLAIVLKHANASPPPHARTEFYSLKQAILERYGKLVGHDMQEIVDRCWGYRHDPCGPQCDKCGGTGIYNKKIIRLERWELASQIFHRPVERISAAFAPSTPTINGRITHRFSKLAFACWRVLTCLFQPQYYLYLDLFRLDEKHLGRFKAVLAYVLEFPRHKWHIEAIRFSEIEQAALIAKRQQIESAMIPF